MKKRRRQILGVITHHGKIWVLFRSKCGNLPLPAMTFIVQKVSLGPRDTVPISR